MKYKHRLLSSAALLALLVLGGCFGKLSRVATNYYVLDYQPGTENKALRRAEPFPMILEVLDADVNRTYARNQLVIKDSFTRVRYLPYDMWANRLSDSVPNLVVRRLQAYNIFKQVGRSTGEFNPDYYLETYIMNMELIESENPQAYMRIDFFFRDSDTQNILLSYSTERYQDMPDATASYLVQVYNDMFMKEVDILATRISLLLEGKEVDLTPPESELTSLEEYVYTEAAESAQRTPDGELMLRLISPQDTEIRYTLEGTDPSANPISRNDVEFNQAVTLKPGPYRVTIGENQEIEIDTVVKSKLRTVIRGEWSELVVKIVDNSRNRVRLSYDLWIKKPSDYDYYHYGTGTSVGEDDLGQPDKVWILAPGTYMVKLGGGSWNDLRNFTTVNAIKGESEILTMVVDPTGVGNFLVGAGILGEDPYSSERPFLHKGAVHANINLSSNNNVDKDKPTYGLNITGQVENNLDINYPMRHYTLRSYYDLGMNRSTNTDMRIGTDSYSLKNVLLFTPWESSQSLRNFSFYGRGDLYTHFFDENLYFAADKNLVRITADGDTLDVRTAQDRVQTKIAFYPLRLKEGTGLTYRWVISPKITLSLRGGYGWQQEFNKRSYKLSSTGQNLATPDGLLYDVYTENKDIFDNGLESTLVLAAINLLNFMTINSTFDVLFPMNSGDTSTRYESENRFNFRIYRNISLDAKLNVQYDKSKSDWAVYDFGSYLRLSLYY